MTIIRRRRISPLLAAAVRRAEMRGGMTRPIETAPAPKATAVGAVTSTEEQNHG